LCNLLLDALLASEERQPHRQHQEGERGQQPADEILDTIATYCQRINDSGH
jgi:hypothetical protein